MKFVKIVFLVIVANLLTIFAISQNYVSQDINQPTYINEISTEQLLFFNHQLESTVSPSQIARDYLGKD